jgi:DNA-directed RNA polymerase subunit omega
LFLIILLSSIQEAYNKTFCYVIRLVILWSIVLIFQDQKMARVTTEDCMDYVENQFDLVLKASKRARDIAYGAQPLVEIDNDKPTVLALREISEGLLGKDAATPANEETESTKG